MPQPWRAAGPVCGRDPGRDPSLCSLQFQDAELAYLRSLRFIKSDFVDFLGLFRLNEIHHHHPQPSGEIEIVIRGPWLHTILFEIPVLAIINEVYFRNTQKVPDFPEGRRRLDAKIAALQADGLGDLKIADYGTAAASAAPGTKKCCACWWPAWVPGDRRPVRRRARAVCGHQQRAVRHEAGRDAPGHHGA